METAHVVRNTELGELVTFIGSSKYLPFVPKGDFTLSLIIAHRQHNPEKWPR